MRGLLKWTGIGCGGLLALFVFLGIVGAILSGLEPKEEVAQEDPVAEELEAPGFDEEPLLEQEGEPEPPQETFTEENYSRLIADPDAYEGAAVDITGLVFRSPERADGEIFLQMYADPANREWSTIVRADDADISQDDYVRLSGSVVGSFEGENLFGGTVSAVGVEADEIEVIDAAEALDPAQAVWEVGQTQTDQGFSLTLERIEFGEEPTRAYVTAYNDTGSPASFHRFNSRIIQGQRQIDEDTPYDFDLPEPQSDIQPGVQTSGALGYGPVDPSQPFRIEFEWSSDDYMNISPNPIVFELAP